MEITVNIQAGELARAIEMLAAAVGGRKADLIVSQPNVNIQPAVTAQIQEQALVTPPLQTAVPTAPIAPPIQQPIAPPFQQQMQQAPVQQQQPLGVPTSAPVYTMEQLAVAATQLMDAGRQSELLQLLASFGAQSLMALPQEQYGVFATKLREMGAKI